MNSVFSAKYLRKLENHSSALAVNILDNSEATHRLMVVGSSPYGIAEFFNLLNSCSCTKALGFTQPLTEMSTRRSF
jgi:hypothetical protein